jgi:hypothetical protein
MSTVEVVENPRKTTLEVLSTFRGHTSVYLEDPEDVEQRAKLGKRIKKMQQEGFVLFLINKNRDTYRIKGYDAQSNEWILFGTQVETPPQTQVSGEEVAETQPAPKRGRGRPRNARVSAEGTTAGAVAPTAGG